MNAFKKIIFVSNEDKTRGPMAAAIMGSLTRDRGYMIESRAARERGMNLQSTFSRQLTSDDFDAETLVLTMDRVQKEKIYKMFSEARNVFCLCEFAGEADVEIPNPYGKGMQEYMECFDVLYGMVFKAADALNGYQDTVR